MTITKKFERIGIGASAILMALSLSACGSTSNAGASGLANMNYHSGRATIVKVHHDKSTLSPRWKYDHVKYSNLDRENRTSKGNTGWLDKNNLAHDSLRTRQVVKPTGYHQKFVNGTPIVNRGHEIAYSLSKGIDQQGKYDPSKESGDQNNMKNLFTQTAFSNQQLQAIYEGKVRSALKKGYKVVFQVKPIFAGHDLMAKGVQMQAISTNHKLNFNVYIYNVQNGIKFNYATGRSTIDRAMKVPMPKHPINYHNNNQSSFGGNHRYNGYGRRYYGGYRGYHHHHYFRDYMIYRGTKHLIRRHYARKYGSYHYHRMSIRHYHRF